MRSNLRLTNVKGRVLKEACYKRISRGKRDHPGGIVIWTNIGKSLKDSSIWRKDLMAKGTGYSIKRSYLPAKGSLEKPRGSRAKFVPSVLQKAGDTLTCFEREILELLTDTHFPPGREPSRLSIEVSTGNRSM